MMLVLVFTPATVFYYGLAFILFRLFDIWKPAPIRQVDAQLKGGLGVMFDDILAAVYAIICIQGLLWINS
jgi:phosphatidylglycerophosphatase A